MRAYANAYVHVCVYVGQRYLSRHGCMSSTSTDSTVVFVRGDIAVARLDGRTGEQAAREESLGYPCSPINRACQSCAFDGDGRALEASGFAVPYLIKQGARPCQWSGLSVAMGPCSLVCTDTKDQAQICRGRGRRNRICARSCGGDEAAECRMQRNAATEQMERQRTKDVVFFRPDI